MLRYVVSITYILIQPRCSSTVAVRINLQHKRQLRMLFNLSTREETRQVNLITRAHVRSRASTHTRVHRLNLLSLSDRFAHSHRINVGKLSSQIGKEEE